MIQSMFNTRQEAQRQLGSEVRTRAADDYKVIKEALTKLRREGLGSNLS